PAAKRARYREAPGRADAASGGRRVPPHFSLAKERPGSFGPPPMAWKTKWASSFHETRPTMTLSSLWARVRMPLPNVYLPAIGWVRPCWVRFHWKPPSAAIVSAIDVPSSGEAFQVPTRFPSGTAGVAAAGSVAAGSGAGASAWGAFASAAAVAVAWLPE